MSFAAFSQPHLLPAQDVSRVMLLVLLALVPGITASWWFFGSGVLVNIVLAVVTALAAEALIMRLRHKPVRATLNDLSATVTAVLIALTIPPLLPWWMTVVGVLFGIVIVKQLFGGLGFNPFNPAMAAYVFLLISFPAEMTRWLAPAALLPVELGLLDALQITFIGSLPAALSWDGITAATVLDEMKTRLALGQMQPEIRALPVFGSFSGVGTEWIAFWYLAGGLLLLWWRVISWHIPLSMLLAIFVMASIFWLSEPDANASPLFHLLSGGALLGAFFIATDPVSAATTRRGQLIFGAGIGVLVYVIRAWGGYPDAVAFAVLLMNMAAPTIDYYSQPRIYGQARDIDSDA